MYRRQYKKKTSLTKQNRLQLLIKENDILNENSPNHLKRIHKSKLPRCRRIWKRLSKLSITDTETSTNLEDKLPEDQEIIKEPMDLVLTSTASKNPYFVDSVNEGWTSKLCFPEMEPNNEIFRRMWAPPTPLSPITLKIENNYGPVHQMMSLKDFLRSTDYRRNEIDYFTTGGKALLDENREKNQEDAVGKLEVGPVTDAEVSPVTDAQISPVADAQVQPSIDAQVIGSLDTVTPNINDKFSSIPQAIPVSVHSQTIHTDVSPKSDLDSAIPALKAAVTEHLNQNCEWIDLENALHSDFFKPKIIETSKATEMKSPEGLSFLPKTINKEPSSLGMEFSHPTELSPVQGIIKEKSSENFFDNIRVSPTDYFSRWPKGWPLPNNDIFRTFEKVSVDEIQTSTVIGDGSGNVQTHTTPKKSKEDESSYGDHEVTQKEMTVEFHADPPGGRPRRCIFSFTNNSPNTIYIPKKIIPTKKNDNPPSIRRVLKKPVVPPPRFELRENKNTLKELMTPKLMNNFRMYSKQRNGLKSGVVITKYRSSVWLSDAGLLDDAIDKARADRLFEEIAGMKLVMTIHDYVRYIMKIALGSKLRSQQIVEKLSSCHLEQTSRESSTPSVDEKSTPSSSDTVLPPQKSPSSFSIPAYTCSTPSFLIH